MMNKLDFEDQLDQIRVAHYERTKGMTASEVIDDINRQGKEIAQKYGIVITKTPVTKRVSN